MLTIEDILGQCPNPVSYNPRSPQSKLVDSSVPVRPQETAGYEDEVFNFLFENRSVLGIRQLARLYNQGMDGVVELTGGSWVPIEIKYRMNWPLACISGHQFRRFLTINEGDKLRVRAGLVFFKEFAGDWARRWQSGLEKGWVYWYTEHHQVEGLAYHLVQFRGGKLTTYSDAVGSDEDSASFALMRLAEKGGAFDFWLEEGEDIYSLQDGEPV